MPEPAAKKNDRIVAIDTHLLSGTPTPLLFDGVSGELDAPAVSRALAGVEDAGSPACRVVGAASAAGGRDDAAVIVARRVA
jgi:hypothetical protein